MYDKMAVLNVLGSLVKNPDLFLEERYKLEVDDFGERFHQIIFSAISNLFHSGVQNIGIIEIDSYISQYSKQYKIFTDNNGFDYIEKCIEMTKLENFEYDYNLTKKYSLLRELKNQGFDISEIYNPDILDIKYQEKMQEKFESMSLGDIIDYFDRKIVDLKERYHSQKEQKGIQASVGIRELVENLKLAPDYGVPLNGSILNTITRGARKGCVYMKSSPSGFGKTRMSIADACLISVSHIYDIKKKEWVSNSFSEPTLFITTELNFDEIQTIILSYISGVSEENILDGSYGKDEEERVMLAIDYLEKSPLFVERISNFSIDDIEMTVKKYRITKNIGYVFFDYIFTSLKMLSEISSKSRGMKLREDNVLYMLISRMKDLSEELNIHFNTSTQVNGDWKNVKNADMSVIRGAKNLADKIDIGYVSLPVSKHDEELIQPIISKGFFKAPNLVFHVYKNRKGKLNNVKLWVHVDLSTQRIEEQFLTDNDYKIINVEAVDIEKILNENE